MAGLNETLVAEVRETAAAGATARRAVRTSSKETTECGRPAALMP